MGKDKRLSIPWSDPASNPMQDMRDAIVQAQHPPTPMPIVWSSPITYERFVERYGAICDGFEAILNLHRDWQPFRTPERCIHMHILVNWPWLRRTYMKVKLTHDLRRHGQRVKISINERLSPEGWYKP